MKIKYIALATASSLFLAACGNQASTESSETAAVAETTESSSELLTNEQKLSYIVGNNMANQFKRDGMTLDYAAFKLAVEDVQAGKESQLSQEQIQETIQLVQAEVQEKAQKAREEQSTANKAQGIAYLEANAKKEGVVVTESGLQYKEIVSGAGDIPTAENTVVVHYKGTLIDGTQFDSSYDRGEPAEFPVTGVIQGWVEALQLMNVGDKFELTIPADLAYGQRGSGQDIGPDATLLFDVELIEIK